MELGNKGQIQTGRRIWLSLVLIVMVALGKLSAQERADYDQLRQQVWDRELAFANTMAERNHQAFREFLAEDVVFFGGKSASHGKQAVADKWAGFFEKDKAPFAWKPEKVEVLQDGSLALSTGPVWDEIGRFHTYTSIWRREKDGVWKIVFDKGDRYCPPQKSK